jgi:hypothetical protein
MPRFRQHDIELARRESEARRAAATALHPVHSPAWHAEYAILKLQDVVQLGLMDCYASFEQSLSDFYPDLPWTQEGAAESLPLILADPRFQEIQLALLALHGFDLGAELDTALREHESG